MHRAELLNFLKRILCTKLVWRHYHLSFLEFQLFINFSNDLHICFEEHLQKSTTFLHSFTRQKTRLSDQTNFPSQFFGWSVRHSCDPRHRSFKSRGCGVQKSVKDQCTYWLPGQEIRSDPAIDIENHLCLSFGGWLKIKYLGNPLVSWKWWDVMGYWGYPGNPMVSWKSNQVPRKHSPIEKDDFGV